MSFQKIGDKLRFDNIALKHCLTKVKKSKNGKRSNAFISGAGKARALVDYLARNYLKHPSNCLKVNKKTLREQLFISAYELDNWIDICVDNNVLRLESCTV